MTTSSTGHPRRPDRPTTPIHTGRRPTFRSSRRPDPNDARQEIWTALSADGRWQYHRLDGVPGTPWEVTYLPTGQNTMVGSLSAARRWTATDAAAASLHRDALAVIERRGVTPGMTLVRLPGVTTEQHEAALVAYTEECSHRVGVASRWLLIHEGRIIPAGGELEPESLCLTCCGPLVYTGGLWRHIDACAECWHWRTGWQIPCHDKMARHVACQAVNPATCEHHHCARPIDTRRPCPRGREWCCGCCDEEPGS